MAREHFGPKQLEVLPLGLSFPLLEARRACRHLASPHWPVGACALLAREDLARQAQVARRAASIRRR